MAKEKLNFENFDDIVFDLLKKENNNSNEIAINWRGYSLEENEIKKIFNIKEYEGTEFSTAVFEYLSNDEGIEDEFDNELHGLAYKVVEKYSEFSENNNDFFELKDKVYEFAKENIKKDYNIDELLKNTQLNELTVVLKNPNTNYPEDNREQTAPFVKNGEKYLETFLNENQYNSVAFLIQSQGYEVEDFFDKEKVKNSKFLNSLHKELNENLSEGKDGNVVFTKIGNSNLEELNDILDNIHNLKIPKEMTQVGIYDIVSKEGSNLQIELEKDIILSKEDYKVFSDYSSGDKFEKNNYFENYENKDNNIKFEITLDKSFKMHEIDINKVKETIDKTFDVKVQEKKEKENEKELW